MKIFKKHVTNPSQPQNALPGVLFLLAQTRALIVQKRMLFAGYAAWVIMPALATFGFSFVDISETWEFIIVNTVLIFTILIHVWVYACITLVALSSLTGTPLEDREIETRVRKNMPLLLYLFAFSFFCIVVGFYLLILPGIVAYTWLAFTRIIALNTPHATFSSVITKSRSLSTGRFFAISRRLVTGPMVFGTGYFIFCLLILGGIFSLTGIDPTDLLTQFAEQGTPLPAWIPLLISALSLPFIPYNATYPVTLYDALKKA